MKHQNKRNVYFLILVLLIVFVGNNNFFIKKDSSEQDKSKDSLSNFLMQTQGNYNFLKQNIEILIRDYTQGEYISQPSLQEFPSLPFAYYLEQNYGLKGSDNLPIFNRPIDLISDDYKIIDSLVILLNNIVFKKDISKYIRKEWDTLQKKKPFDKLIQYHDGYYITNQDVSYPKINGVKFSKFIFKNSHELNSYCLKNHLDVKVYIDVSKKGKLKAHLGRPIKNKSLDSLITIILSKAEVVEPAMRIGKEIDFRWVCKFPLKLSD